MSRHHDMTYITHCTRRRWGCGNAQTSSLWRQNVFDTSETGVKYMLKNSQLDYYTIGMYGTQMDQYVSDGPNDNKLYRQYDYGNFYKSKTFYDPMKRRCVLWGWAKESDNKAKGWAGIYVCAVAAPQSMDQSAALSMFGTSHHEP
jgi:hypothetical protein